MHFAKDIAIAKFSRVKETVLHRLFDLPKQKHPVLKLSRRALLSLSAAKVAIEVGDLKGWLELPAKHGIKGFEGHLSVEFKLQVGTQLLPGQCGELIYIEGVTGIKYKIAQFISRYSSEFDTGRYRAIALSPNIEFIEQEEKLKFKLYNEEELYTEFKSESDFINWYDRNQTLAIETEDEKQA